MDNRGSATELLSEGLGIFWDQFLKDQDEFKKTLSQIFSKWSFLSRTTSNSKTPIWFFHEKDTIVAPPQYGTQTSDEYFEISFWKIRTSLKNYFLRFFQNGLFWCELSNFPNLGSRIEIILCESYWAVTVSDRYT